jgi:hypothetical protein
LETPGSKFPAALPTNFASMFFEQLEVAGFFLGEDDKNTV